ncbi:MAG: hypothetical protein KF820_07215 [Candidatus Paracaedibacteraceae bacterium]|nr:hypothetical protein [Candidatus Paracaedibacteraceae bacterium]
MTYFIDITTLATMIIMMGFLFSHQVRNSESWRATVTPLASIIGSGFLIIAPLLWMFVGIWSPLVLVGTVTIAYFIGDAIRHNILMVEPLVEQGTAPPIISKLSHASYFSLGLAYLISVAFYIRLLAAFVLKLMDIDESFYADILSSSVLAFIGISGYIKGLDHLENLELASVNSKIAIIVAFCVGIFIYDWKALNFTLQNSGNAIQWNFETFQKLCGILLIVQGFETSRYLGSKYSPETRVKTMKRAQIISALIYFIFVSLSMFLMKEHHEVSETEIINIVKEVSVLFPIILVFGAVFSQFSSAVADTIGCGGLLSEATQSRLTLHQSYALVTTCAIILIWSANIFQIITLASRAFALYYMLQAVEALVISRHSKSKNTAQQVIFACISILMLLVLIFAKSAEG